MNTATKEVLRSLIKIEVKFKDGFGFNPGFLLGESFVTFSSARTSLIDLVA